MYMRRSRVENLLIKFTVDNIKPIQSNDSYVPSYNHSKKYSYFRKSDELKKMQAEFHRYFDLNPLDEQELTNLEDYINSGDSLLDLVMVVRMPKSDMYYKNGKLKTKDTSNFVKPLEDCIYDYLDIDDKYNTIVHTERVSEDRDNYSIEVYIFKGYTSSIFNTILRRNENGEYI